MMGHICTLLMGMVERHHGEEGVDRIFALSGVARQRFRTEVLYPDELFQALLQASMELYGVDNATAQEAFSDVLHGNVSKEVPRHFQ